MNNTQIILNSLLLLAICLSGCLTSKQLNKKKPSVPAAFSQEKFNGVYNNKAKVYDNRSTLWEILYAYNTNKREYLFSKDSLYVAPNTTTRLQYDGEKTLTASLMQGDSIFKIIHFKVKLKNEYLAPKLNIYLIPIPIIFFNDKEWLISFSIDQHGNLILKNGFEHFVWIGLAAMVTSYHIHEYQKISQ